MTDDAGHLSVHARGGDADSAQHIGHHSRLPAKLAEEVVSGPDAGVLESPCGFFLPRQAPAGGGDGFAHGEHAGAGGAGNASA